MSNSPSFSGCMENPNVLFIFEKSHNGNLEEDYPKFFKILNAFKFTNENSSFCNIAYSSSNLPVYNIKDNVEYILDIIKSINSKIIVTVGNSSSRLMIGSKFRSIGIYGLSTDAFLKNERIYIPICTPEFYVKSETSMIELKNHLRLINKVITSDNGMPINVINANDISVSDFEDDTDICLTYKQFDDFCKRCIDNSDRVGYDVETNAKLVTSVDHRIVGFSLASNKDNGCYVVFNSIDYTMDSKDKKLIESRMRKILLNKQVFVYNCSHELPVTLNWLGIEIPNIEDLLVMVKLMMGNADKYAGNGGLKIQCNMNLNIKDWSIDLDLFMELFRNFDNSIEELNKLLLKYYNKDEIPELINKLKEKHDNINLSDKVLPYDVVPFKLIGKYGGIDSSVLFPLYNYYISKMDEINRELGINLINGYKYWMKHHLAGYTLERNGAYWNEDRAIDVENWCSDGMKNCLTIMTKSKLSRNYIKDKVKYYFYNHVKESYIGEILGTFAVPKRMYKSSCNVVLCDTFDNKLLRDFGELNLVPNKKGEYKLELSHIEILANKYLSNIDSLYEDWFVNYFDSIINNKDTSLSDLKSLINPTATAQSFKDFLSNILISDKIRYAKLYSDLVKLVEVPNFDLNNYYGDSDKKLLSLIIKLKSQDMKDSTKLDIMVKFLNSNMKLSSRYIKNKISDALDYKLTSTDDDTIIELFTFYEMCGLDVENMENWSEEFKWLYNFRLYKKFSKMISTYINGKVGRNSVWFVDEKSYRNGDNLTKREIQYWDKDKYNINNKIPMLQSSFFVDSADTGRWRCFTGDTKLKCLDGNSYSFKELVDNNINELWVYSRDRKGNIVPAKAINPCITKIVNKLCKITLDTGEIIKCTLDHKFMLKDGSYCEAQYLTSEMSLMPLYLRTDSKGYIQYYNDNKFKYENVHTLVNSYVNNEEHEFVLNNSEKRNYPVTHHKDFDKKNNNTPENLKWMLLNDHWTYHAKLGRERLIEFNKSERGRSTSKTEKHRDMARKIRIEFNKSDKMRESSKKVAENFLNNCEGRKRSSERISQMNKSEESRQRSREMVISGKSLYKNDKARQEDRKRCIERNKNDFEKEKMIKGRILSTCKKILDNNLEINETNYKDFKSRTTPTFKNAVIKFGCLEDLIEASINYNHKIINIEIIETMEEVYDITVPEFHNFALDVGIFVHNSGFHTLPGTGCIKGIYTSRYKGGVIAMPDCSQAEVRILAAACGEENLMKAFQDGLDIHKYVASLCFHNGDQSLVTKTERKIAKGAVFGILYGESEQSFADSFTNSDLNEALKIFDYFYTAFPKIKDYVEGTHKQFLDTGKVALSMFDRFINLEPLVLENGSDTNKVLRQSQNYPIQGMCCDLAGMILYNVCKYISDNNLKSKPFCFIHDSIEIDIHPDETFLMLDKLKPLFNNYPWDTFGVPMASDIVFSSNMGAEIEVKEMVHDNDYNDVTITLVGFKDDIYEVEELWKSVYSRVEKLSEEIIDEKYVPISGLFQKKVIISKHMGHSRQECEVTYHVIRKEN